MPIASGVRWTPHRTSSEIVRHAVPELNPMALSRFSEPIRPMALGDMRANGIHSLAVSCRKCWHEVVIDAAPWPDETPLRSLGPRMVCTNCGVAGADVRPNRERQSA
jgi:hypothetical protein